MSKFFKKVAAAVAAAAAFAAKGSDVGAFAGSAGAGSVWAW